MPRAGDDDPIEIDATIVGDAPVDDLAEADGHLPHADPGLPPIAISGLDGDLAAEALDHADQDHAEHGGAGRGAADRDALPIDSGSLVPFDPLSRYLAEMRRFPLLTREEETVVAKRYAAAHDPADAYRLVTANLRLVVKIANEFARAARNLLDLIQEGNVGLMEAVKHFNPDLGIRFPSYAVWWVRAYMYRHLINNWRLVKVGTTQAQRKLFFNLRKESERLEAEGFAPQPKLLAQRMGVKESEVREMQERMAQSEVSLDQPSVPGEETSLIESLPDTSYTPEEAAAHTEWRDFAHNKVEEFAATLSGKELEIFRDRLLAEDPPTLQEIGAKFGISRERVRQIENRLKRQLKAFLTDGADDLDRPET
ncbi:MAG: RNA polymerase factor sigma-32 [Candidatus Binataceae bacterium]|nr:RNA polymerase factor sigma-32 [Candidatus Binataceae bacterium]